MSAMREYLATIINYILSIGVVDVLDIIIIAYIIYEVIRLIRRTGSARVALGIVVILIALWLSSELGMNMVNFILRKTVELGLLALVILFQPELRRGLEHVGSGRVMRLFSMKPQAWNVEAAITQTVLACADMAKDRVGALIVFERTNNLSDRMSTGTILDADTTAELLKNIFYPKAPLHDGAVIIKEGRITSAGCMLPLSANKNLSRDLGMRHRAGIGMSEQSDAVVVIVSEETGSMSVAIGGMLKRHLSLNTLEQLLKNALIPEDDAGASPRSRLLGKFGVKKNG